MYNRSKDFDTYVTDFIIVLLGLCFYYYCYRYAFQYNDEGTSPTYSATPEIFKLAKYIVLLAIYVFFHIKVISIRRPPDKLYVNSSLCILISCFLILFGKGLFWHDLDLLKMTMISCLPIFFYIWGRARIDFERISKFIYYFFVFGLLYEFLQIFLFYKFGRLPALAYENSFSVRFGGPWDDPNGWGICLSFFVPFMYFYKKEHRNIWAILGIMVLLLSQSLTAIISFIFSMISLLFLIKKKKRVAFVVWSMIIVIPIIYIIFQLLNNDFVIAYMEVKQGSVEDHSNSLNFIQQFQWYNYFIGMDDFVFNESDYVNFLYIGGIPMLLLYLVLIYRVINYYVKTIENGTHQSPFSYASLAFLISYLVSSVNLPCSRIFYVFLLFNIILCSSNLFLNDINNENSY